MSDSSSSTPAAGSCNPRTDRPHLQTDRTCTVLEKPRRPVLPTSASPADIPPEILDRTCSPQPIPAMEHPITCESLHRIKIWRGAHRSWVTFRGNLGSHGRYLFGLIQYFILRKVVISRFAIVIVAGMPFVHWRWNTARWDDAFLWGARSLDDVQPGI